MYFVLATSHVPKEVPEEVPETQQVLNNKYLLNKLVVPCHKEYLCNTYSHKGHSKFSAPSFVNYPGNFAYRVYSILQTNSSVNMFQRQNYSEAFLLYHNITIYKTSSITI